MDYDVKIGTWIRWIILIPVWGNSLCLSGLGWIGLGFGAGLAVVGFLCAFPVSLLNFWVSEDCRNWNVVGSVCDLSAYGNPELAADQPI